MIRILYISLALSAFLTNASGQDGTIFPKGEKAANVHHVGNIWLNELSAADSDFTFDHHVRLQNGLPADYHIWPND